MSKEPKIPVPDVAIQSAWLKRLAHMICETHWNRQRKQKRIPLQTLNDLPGAVRLRVSEAVDQGYLAGVLDTLMAFMDEAQANAWYQQMQTLATPSWAAEAETEALAEDTPRETTLAS